jgi:hypothetical protein
LHQVLLGVALKSPLVLLVAAGVAGMAEVLVMAAFERELSEDWSQKYCQVEAFWDFEQRFRYLTHLKPSLLLFSVWSF